MSPTHWFGLEQRVLLHPALYHAPSHLCPQCCADSWIKSYSNTYKHTIIVCAAMQVYPRVLHVTHKLASWPQVAFTCFVLESAVDNRV